MQNNHKEPKMNDLFKFAVLTLLMPLIWSCNEQAKATNVTKEQRKKIELVTDYGTMIIELYNETPLHRDNFINLAQNNAYDSVLFHRVIKDFMIQAGDPESKFAKVNDTLGEGDVPYRVAAELNANLFHKKGVLAAARDNNPEKASSGMQFYIVQGKIFNDSTLAKAELGINKGNAKDYFKDDLSKKPLLDSVNHAIETRNLGRYHLYMDSLLSLAQREDDFKLYTIPENQREVYKSIGGTPHLDQNYTVFGEIIEGLTVLDSIANVQTGDLDRPLGDVRIQTIRVLE